jgi:hypothetical protein
MSLFNFDFFVLEIIKYFRFKKGIKHYDFRSFINLKLINKKFYTIISSQDNRWDNIFWKILDYSTISQSPYNYEANKYLCKMLSSDQNAFLSYIDNNYYIKRSFTIDYEYHHTILIYHDTKALILLSELSFVIDNLTNEFYPIVKFNYFNEKITDLISYALIPNDPYFSINNKLIDELTDEPKKFIKFVMNMSDWPDDIHPFNKIINNLYQLYKKQST